MGPRPYTGVTLFFICVVGALHAGVAITDNTKGAVGTRRRAQQHNTQLLLSPTMRKEPLDYTVVAITDNAKGTVFKPVSRQAV